MGKGSGAGGSSGSGRRGRSVTSKHKKGKDRTVHGAGGVTPGTGPSYANVKLKTKAGTREVGSLRPGAGSTKVGKAGRAEAGRKKAVSKFAKRVKALA